MVTEARRRNEIRVVAVNDAYRLLPNADILYACDAAWWRQHSGCPGFAGERWSSHNLKAEDDKSEIADRYGVNLVAGDHKQTFSHDPGLIHYGSNSGFQGINVAILKGADPVILVGFNMSGGTHFFGRHPPGLLQNSDFSRFVPNFEYAARHLRGVTVINATPGSALKCFPMMDLPDALSHSPSDRSSDNLAVADLA